jgi:hypothetical protein
MISAKGQKKAFFLLQKAHKEGAIGKAEQRCNGRRTPPLLRKVFPLASC